MRVRNRVSGLVAAVVLTALIPAVPAMAVSPNVVISQVYGGGGNAGATYTHDFIELFNRGNSPVSLNGWSVQYASPTGAGNFGNASTTMTPLGNFLLQPGQYLLIQGAIGAGGTTPLPTPDQTDGTAINLGATGGKVALVNNMVGLGCNGNPNVCSPAALASIIDLVGYGNANFFEGAGAAPAPANTTADLRNENGCVETDNNNADFSVAAPNPRNTSSPSNACGGPNADVEIDCGPALQTDAGTAASQSVSASDLDGTVVDISVAAVLPPPASGSITIANLVPAASDGGTATADVVVDDAVPPGAYAVDLNASNDDSPAQTAACSLSVTVHDVVAPHIALTATPNVMWSPNHKYVPVEVLITVDDDFDPSPTVELVSVTSNEPDDQPGGGDGNTNNDIVVLDQNSFRLRAERAGGGSGRIYTIDYRAMDASGNATTGSVQVVVPNSASG